MNVPPGAKVPLAFADAGADSANRFERNLTVIQTMARVEPSVAGSSESAEVRDGAIQIVFEDSSLMLKIADFIDIAEERARLERERGKMQGEIDKIDKKLGNEKFLSRAPEAVVEEQRERRSEADLSCRKLDEALGRLSWLSS
jgi:valyl-tRNA synthetase